MKGLLSEIPRFGDDWLIGWSVRNLRYINFTELPGSTDKWPVNSDRKRRETKLSRLVLMYLTGETEEKLGISSSDSMI